MVDLVGSHGYAQTSIEMICEQARAGRVALRPLLRRQGGLLPLRPRRGRRRVLRAGRAAYDGATAWHDRIWAAGWAAMRFFAGRPAPRPLPGRRGQRHRQRRPGAPRPGPAAARRHPRRRPRGAGGARVGLPLHRRNRRRGDLRHGPGQVEEGCGRARRRLPARARLHGRDALPRLARGRGRAAGPDAALGAVTGRSRSGSGGRRCRRGPRRSRSPCGVGQQRHAVTSQVAEMTDRGRAASVYRPLATACSLRTPVAASALQGSASKRSSTVETGASGEPGRPRRRDRDAEVSSVSEPH